MVFVLWGVSVMTFAISQAIPGDPAVAAAGQSASAATVQAIRREMGLDRPAIVQYGLYLRRAVAGNLGRSIMTQRPVLADLLSYYPATIQLAVASLVFSCLLGVPVGVITAVKHGQLADHLIRVASLFAVSMPIFWLGLMYQFIFYGKLQWLPAAGQLSADIKFPGGPTGFLVIDSLLRARPDVFLDALEHLLLPVLALSGITMAAVSRITRASVLEVLAEPYVTVARAKGLYERRVMGRHVLRNAAVPILSIVGIRFGHTLAGAILVETIFSWPGVGQYAVLAIQNKDFPAIVGVTLTVTLLFSLVNLAIDLSHAWTDPRMITA
jgi:peptide/nickel transport system permease protein